MTGHHEIRTFHYQAPTNKRNLQANVPPDWKPFAAMLVEGIGLVVVARRWVRDEKPTQRDWEEVVKG